MKKKIVGILIFTLYITAIVLPVTGITLQKPGNSTLQPPIEWEKTYGCSMVDWGRCVQQTSDGGYILSGAYDRNVYMPWQGFVYLLKTDAMGNVEWDKQYGIYPYENLGQYIQQTSDGGYIIAGYIGHTYHIDAYVLKTDSGGNLIWTRILGKFDYYDNSLSIQQTTDGGYIVTGWTGSYGAGSSDVWLIKLNSDGEDEWNKTFGGSGLDGGDCVKQTFDGGFIITGRTDSFDSGGNGDAWLIKTDMYGNEIWNKSYGGHYLDNGKSVLQTSDGGYILTGSTYSFGSGNHDAWLIKTDMYGNEIWNNTYGGSLWDQGKSVVQTADGGYFITGDYTDPIQGDLELFMIKTDSEGVEEWNYIIEHDSKGYTDSGSYGIQTTDGGYIVTGETGEYNLAKVDLLLIKLEGENQPPDVPTIDGPIEGYAGVIYKFNTITTDPEGNDVYYKIDWGDETYSDWYGPFQSGVGLSVNHIWSEGGIYFIRVKAKDIYNAESNWSEYIQVIILDNNLPTAPEIEGETNGDVGTEYDYEFIATDSDGDDIAEFIVKWGDGSVEEIITGPFTSGTAAIANHIYISGGYFSISAKAKDIKGAVGPEGILEVTMQKNRVLNLKIKLLQGLLEQFPILQMLLQRFGLQK